MSKETYQPIATISNDYKLKPPTRGTEKELHAHIVKWPGHSLEERQAICETEGWTPEHAIPELNKDVRMEVSAIRTMMKRIGDDTDKLHEELTELVDRFSDEVKVEAINADEYWLGLCRLIFKGLPDEISADDLNFREIRRGYNAFFEG